MTNKERFLAGHHFTISNEWGQFTYYYDHRGFQNGGMIVHYKGKNLPPRRMGIATIDEDTDSFTIVIKGLLVGHEEVIALNDLDFGYG
ncbi:hypothetical protein LZD49_32200 [Dyadobacter sp. CY261]|uniref:hypothetical protein n=1 Tax=Dyadobacter sp. CY261 TaxID=2907203 RepID=UPI001F22B98E|nr:hypothetical protein [Dyadobacter sp. CY261]MCF0075189.1 hypothetical protein [Dyadobacter sp. CY261]